MTTQTVHIHTYDYGASLSSATLRNVSDDTLVATADTVNEVTADSGLYAAVFGEVSVIAAGEYRLRAVVSGKPINRYVTLAGTNNEVAEARSERLAVLDTVRQQALADLAAMITGSGTGDAKFDAMALSLAPSGSSSGDWTDGEKAQIRYRLGLDGTATAPTEPEAEPIVVTPATGIMTTGWLVTRVNGVPTAGVVIRYQLAQEPDSDTGSSYDTTVYTSTSNSIAIAELPLVKGAYYYIWRNSASRPANTPLYQVPADAGNTLELPSHVGK